MSLPSLPGRRPVWTAIRAYWAALQRLGRISGTNDIPTLTPTIIGAAHLLFTDQESGPSDDETLHEVIAIVLDGAITNNRCRAVRQRTQST